MRLQAMHCVLASSDGCSVVAAGQDGCAHMWRLEAQTLAVADSYRLPQAKRPRHWQLQAATACPEPSKQTAEALERLLWGGRRPKHWQLQAATACPKPSKQTAEALERLSRGGRRPRHWQLQAATACPKPKEQAWRTAGAVLIHAACIVHFAKGVRRGAWRCSACACSMNHALCQGGKQKGLLVQCLCMQRESCP
eukprot:scaffold152016_cov18-Tisochrysis_lutea.AAC.2